ncbi:MAG: hypothetical protein UV78_C0015G0011 [Parcubacteria group bacterium GW2011_GWA2_43_17]|nr:MAG: hypothetical protein UV78_C0015G0011 [Parcubacteria group bacterium GW2011_GWA2_43_17]KKT94502.1 MAG: hypothetical protein UW91_C0001G0066 [Parcubacteria group bacterium GW2011_GWF2_45_11]KKT98128.1 MAG: hypothetical protein UW98_C0010G0012 [Parcubacteria group bacterium GW2011_GWC2_45_15]
MGKRIVFLLMSVIVILVMIQNEVSVWAYVITLALIMVIWSFFEK